MQRLHTAITSVLGFLTYPWGAQPCARVSSPLTISGKIKQRLVPCGMGSASSLWAAAGSPALAGLISGSGRCWWHVGSLLLHQDTSDHESPSCGSLAISDRLGLALAKFLSGELKLVFAGRSDARFMVSHALADLMSRLCPLALPAFSCDF